MQSDLVYLKHAGMPERRDRCWDRTNGCRCQHWCPIVCPGVYRH